MFGTLSPRIFLNTIIEKLKPSSTPQVIFYCDNIATIKNVKNPTRHYSPEKMDLKHAYTRYKLLKVISDAKFRSTTEHVKGHSDLEAKEKELHTCLTWAQFINIKCDELAKLHNSTPYNDLHPRSTPIQLFPDLHYTMGRKPLIQYFSKKIHQLQDRPTMLKYLQKTKIQIQDINQIDIQAIEKLFQKGKN